MHFLGIILNQCALCILAAICSSLLLLWHHVCFACGRGGADDHEDEDEDEDDVGVIGPERGSNIVGHLHVQTHCSKLYMLHKYMMYNMFCN